MSEQVQNQENDEPDYLGMSDEDFLNAPVPSETTGSTETQSEEANQEETESDADEGDSSGSEEGVEGEGDIEEESTRRERGESDEQRPAKESDKDKEQKPHVEEVSRGEPGAKKEVRSASGEATGSTKETSEQGASDKEAVAVDYKAEYERVMAPFKANGKDFKVDSVDDVIQLMQMGANYNKKMASLKPVLKLVKMLENNGLMNEEKINFLIDVSKGNQNAVSKLVTDGKLDPVDLDADKASAYRPSSYRVDDREIDLETVMDEIKDSPKYGQLVTVVGDTWDAASKRVIADNPELLRIIHTSMENGVYDLIASEIDKERVLGRLNGVSDLQAYRQIGDALHARGAFNHIFKGSSQDDGKAAPRTVAPPAKPKSGTDDKLNEKRRAASATKSAVPAPKVSNDFSPLAMSDEEFLKQANSRYS